MYPEKERERKKESASREGKKTRKLAYNKSYQNNPPQKSMVSEGLAKEKHIGGSVACRGMKVISKTNFFQAFQSQLEMPRGKARNKGMLKGGFVSRGSLSGKKVERYTCVGYFARVKHVRKTWEQHVPKKVFLAFSSGLLGGRRQRKQVWNHYPTQTMTQTPR